MSDNGFAYTGGENLEVMSHACNYNQYLAGLVTRRLESMGRRADQLRMLDFGAGSGTYADILRADKRRIECLEPDERLRGTLERKGYRTLSNEEELEPEAYDLIYSFNVLEHIEDDSGAFRRMSESLRPGGIMVIYVPAFQVLFSSMDQLVGHHRRYKTKQLRAMAAGNGLRIKELRYCDPAGFGAALLYRIKGGDGRISPRSLKLYDSAIFPVSRTVEPLTGRFFGKNAVLVAQK